ncbi:MAG: hypothetical protein WC043_05910 [Pseudobdellovibrionaceae bacterium]
MSVREGMLASEALEGAGSASIVSVGAASALRTHAIANALGTQGVSVALPENNCNSFNAASVGVRSTSVNLTQSGPSVTLGFSA